jgi:hypothetical protein
VPLKHQAGSEGGTGFQPVICLAAKLGLDNITSAKSIDSPPPSPHRINKDHVAIQPHGLLMRAANLLKLSGFHTQGALRRAHQLAKQAVAIGGEDRELFAVDRHARLLEPVDQAAVAEPVFAR